MVEEHTIRQDEADASTRAEVAGRFPDEAMCDLPLSDRQFSIIGYAPCEDWWGLVRCGSAR